ncbi:MAG TPA: carbohydrate ABC transporter permease [Anaerolineales bacterium]|nr:carbohydrate ABC transporter permease [Anaerolineales bacterium]
MSVAAETQPKVRRQSGSKAFSQWFGGLPLRLTIVLIAFIWTLPTVGLLISSFREPIAIQTSGWWDALLHPFEEAQWTIENYATVFTEGDMGTAFLNSFLVTVPSVVIPITIAAFAAYAFAWLQFPGRNFLFALVIALMVVPLHMALIPMLRLYTNLNLNGTFLGVWLAHTGFGLPLAVYLLHGYISSLPKEIIESAQIDGASPMTTFTNLVLPLSVPAIASFAIFQFLWVWNDLLVALVFLGTSRDTAVVTANLARLIGDRGQDWHLLTAGAFVTMIVPLIIFFSLQRYFVRGLTAGSVKG